MDLTKETTQAIKQFKLYTANTPKQKYPLNIVRIAYKRYGFFHKEKHKTN